jgi:hypothetical protein
MALALPTMKWMCEDIYTDGGCKSEAKVMLGDGFYRELLCLPHTLLRLQEGDPMEAVIDIHWMQPGEMHRRNYSR